MKKSLVLQPKDFRQTLHFWLRRPDYGWRELWDGSALTVEPFEERLERTPGGRPRWRIRQVVQGMSTTVYVDANAIQPDGFTVYELPTDSWWQNEGREIFFDYLKFGTRNAPTAHALAAMALLFTAFIYMVVGDSSGSLAFLSDSEIPHLTKWLALLIVGTPTLSLAVNKFFPSRTYLATLFFRAEAWLLLISALAALPQIPHGIRDFRVKVLQAAAEQNAIKDQRSPASR
jgi:hypothetical protein